MKHLIPLFMSEAEIEKKLQKYRTVLVRIAASATSSKDLSCKEVTQMKKSPASSLIDPSKVWFDVSVADLAKSLSLNCIKPIDMFPKVSTSSDPIKHSVNKFIALDCEFVGVGPEGKQHALARVSLVNFHGQVLYDNYVKPLQRITDFRTAVSGISPQNLKDSYVNFKDAQAAVAKILKDKILIGHSLKNDFRVLLLNHPRKDIRDTSKFPAFRKHSKGKTPSLKKLAECVLGLKIQEDSHCSIEDAQTAMLLYRSVKEDWERSVLTKRRPKAPIVKKK